MNKKDSVIGNFRTIYGYILAIFAVSRISVNVSRWAVERYRWKAVYYAIVKEGELFRSLFAHGCLGFFFRYDGTRVKLNEEGRGSTTSEIVVRSLTGVALICVNWCVFSEVYFEKSQ